MTQAEKKREMHLLWPAHWLLHTISEYVMFWDVVHTVPARWLSGLETPFVLFWGPDLIFNSLDFIPETPSVIVYCQVGHNEHLVHIHWYIGHGANSVAIPWLCHSPFSSGTCQKFNLDIVPQIQYKPLYPECTCSFNKYNKAEGVTDGVCLSHV